MSRAICLVVAAGALLAACAAQATRPPAPTIDTAGLIAEQRFYPDRIWFRLESGQTWEAQTGTYRQIMNWGGELLVAGSDANGRWFATLGHQGGLPESCYFTPERGTEWGDGIAIAEVLFPKAPAFAFDSPPAIGVDYPLGARFCFNASGQVTSVIEH